MSISKTKPLQNTSTRALRQFACGLAVFLCLLLGLVIPWSLTLSFPWWPWVLSIVILGVSVLFPRSLLFVYIPWMLFSEKFSAFNNCVILATIYFIIITPMAIILRLFGVQLISKKPDKSSGSYRVPATIEAKEQMEKPF